MMTRLLLLSCSKQKREDPCPLPALERYEGGSYKVVKKAMREGIFPPDVEICIVSAQYGLLEAGEMILSYNHKMTPSRATELRPLISRRLDAVLRQGNYDEVFISMSALYRQTLTDSRELERLKLMGRVHRTTGGIGLGLRQTRDWLLARSAQAA